MKERFCYLVLTNMITLRPRKTRAMLEHELSEIYRLLHDGISPGQMSQMVYASTPLQRILE
jgi:hypothetical protein